jgi:acylphosphatase
MMPVARHVRVRGHVQGVFFRAWTKEQAEQLGIHGWVRNCPDGSVEAHLEGEEDLVKQLIERLAEGPPSAEVSKIDIVEVEPEDFRRFAVARSF